MINYVIDRSVSNVVYGDVNDSLNSTGFVK